MSSGWIKLHRRLKDWEWYSDVNTSRLFIHLLITVNHKDANWRGITIKRGSRLTSLDKLSAETSLSVSKIRTSVKKLILTNELATKSHTQHTVFIVKNYDDYQGDDKQNDKPIAIESQTDDKRIATNKNVNNEKNGKNEKKVPVKEPIKAGGLVLELFDYWVDVMKKNKATTKLTPKREKAIKARLKDGYSEFDIKTAILNCSNDPFSMGDNPRQKPFNDIELICRTGEKLESFIDPGVTNGQHQQLTQQRTSTVEQSLRETAAYGEQIRLRREERQARRGNDETLGLTDD